MSTTALRKIEVNPAPQNPANSNAPREITRPSASERHPALKWVMPLVVMAMAAGFGTLLVDLLSGLDVTAVMASALATPPQFIGLSFLFSALSYGALMGYDAFGVRAATGKPVS